MNPSPELERARERCLHAREITERQRRRVERLMITAQPSAEASLRLAEMEADLDLIATNLALLERQLLADERTMAGKVDHEQGKPA